MHSWYNLSCGYRLVLKALFDRFNVKGTIIIIKCHVWEPVHGNGGTDVYECDVDELKKADELNHSLRSQLHESRQMAVIMWTSCAISPQALQCVQLTAEL